MRIDDVEAVVAPVVASLGLELFDVTLARSGRVPVLRVAVDRPGGVDLDAVAAATEALSPTLDHAAAVPGPYTLEVTSPGLERRLRTPRHFAGAVGTAVSVKVREPGAGAERLRGVLVAADDDGIVVECDGRDRRLGYGVVEQARTVFEWGPAPRPAGKVGTRHAPRAHEEARR